MRPAALRLPSGTITFLFTDIEGSTRLWETQRAAMQRSLPRHDIVLRAAVESNGGYVFKTVGDAFCAAFGTARDGLQCALDAQRSIGSEPWDVKGGIRVRMALHTGTAEERNGDYFGQALNRAARLQGIAHGAQVLVSLVTEELLRDNLPDDVSLSDVGEHRLKDLMRPEKVYQVVAPGLRADFPPLRSLDAHLHNLPLQPTPFLGREKELAAVTAILGNPTVRVLTLAGPGGTGKTRLALQAAADMSESFADGTWFVDLSAIDTPGFVLPAIIRTLGIRETGTLAPLELLREFTQKKRVLLLLDNVEQIARGDSPVARILGACPTVKLLVTSREPLHLRGEHLFRVPPLSVPPVRRASRMDREALRPFEAVSLFIERAQSVQPEFTVTNDNAPAVAEICARLDGLPLAIELAAARIALFPPREILDRLSHRLSLLTGGFSDLPHRQQTLRAAIDWSYRLLLSLERTLFREMSVFPGGATLAALERVCVCGGEAGDSILQALAGLVDKSLLVRQDGAGASVFVMLESIREYAQELLEKTGTAGALREAHARYFLEAAEAQHASGARGVSRRELDWFESVHDNLQAAHELFHAAGSVVEELRLCAAREHYWLYRGHLSAGREALERALSAGGEAHPRLRARLLRLAGQLETARGAFEDAERALLDSRSISSAEGDREGLSWCDRSLGELERRRGRLDLARQHFTASIGERITETTYPALEGIGLVEWQEGRIPEARQAFRQVEEWARRTGNDFLLAQVRGNLGILMRADGDEAGALAAYAEALKLYESLGDTESAIIALNNLGVLHAQRGSARESLACFVRVRAAAREIGNKRWACLAECGVADALRMAGEVGRAVETAREAVSIGEGLGRGLELGVALRVLADAFLAAEDVHGAVGFYQRAMPILEEQRDEEDLVLARKGLEMASRAAGA